ncbi:MAG TPA: VOC family protein [Streptomyces sp.]|jgi:PhnB protein|nr:VOC family protein [Streptomyces sp.]
MTGNRAFEGILSEKLPGTRAFFSELPGFGEAFDSDWFNCPQGSGKSGNEPLVRLRVHELVPGAHREAPSGTLPAFVLEDVESAYKAAREQDGQFAEPPRDTFFGQRSILIADPNGQLPDVSTPVMDLPAGQDK